MVVSQFGDVRFTPKSGPFSALAIRSGFDPKRTLGVVQLTLRFRTLVLLYDNPAEEKKVSGGKANGNK